MKIKLSNWKEAEIEKHVNTATLILRILCPDHEYRFGELDYDDLIDLATALMKIAEEIK